MANSSIVISADGVPVGEPIQVPMGTSLNVNIEVAPDELLGRGLRLKSPSASFTPSFRTISPSNADGSNAYGLAGPLFYNAGGDTQFQFTTLNLLPGEYELISLVYNPDNQLQKIGNSPVFVRSNAFEIIAGVGDDLLPEASNFETTSDLLDAVIQDIAEDNPRELALYNLNGQAVNSVRTGDFVVLAVNTSNMTAVQNQVFFKLDTGNEVAPFTLFEVFPFSEFVNDQEFVNIADLPPETLSQGVRNKIFYIPPHQSHTRQSGTLVLSLAYQTPEEGEASLNVQLMDDPVEVLADNSVLNNQGNPRPLQTQTVTIATIGADYPAEHYQALANDIQTFFSFSTRGYFAIEVNVQHYRLEDLDIDYAQWWNDLPKNEDAEPLDPNNPDDLFYIRHIYAHENRINNINYLKELHPLQKDGEDITLYQILEFGAGGGRGAGQSALEIHTYWSHKLMSQDYRVDGGYGAPTERNDPSLIWDTVEKRGLEANISVHEIGHVYWNRPIRMNCGHANAYHMHESQYQPPRFYRFIRYLDGVDKNQARRAIGWGDTVMSYTRNRNLLDQYFLSDQLATFIDAYAPPELSFLAKLPEAPIETAADTITVNVGDSIELIIAGSSPSGLRMMWYFQDGANAVRRMYSYGNIDSYKRTYEAQESDLISFDEPGEYILKANCRDILYYLPHGGKVSNAKTIGYPHQASENGGLREIRITVL